MLRVGALLKCKYRVEKEIARGGMGAVYLATNEEFGTSVAIKEILENQALNPSVREGFLREANFLLNLDHPNLPRIFEVFEEKNLLYVVMRYIAGKDLFERLTEGHKPDGTAVPLPLSDVLAIADTLLGALEYLHGLKSPVIHRDIKPSNLKIGPDGTLYLLDFGLAKTVVTVAYGHTPGFASPEQENRERTDTRSDLYSVGATLYSLLAGLYQLPPAQTRFAAHLRTDPDPIQPLDRLNPNVPRAICEVFEKAMTLEPAKRPASAKEMRELLKAALNTSPLTLNEELLAPFAKHIWEEHEMDQLVTKLLQEIHSGKTHFEPETGSKADMKAFQPIAKALLFAEAQGFLDGLRTHKESQTGNDWYDLAYLTNGLSHKGTLALLKNSTGKSSDPNTKRKEVVRLIGRLLPAEVRNLMTLMGMPVSLIPNGQGTTNADISSAFIEWADSTSRLDELMRELDELEGKR